MEARAAYWAALELRDRDRALEVAEGLRRAGWSSTEIIERLVVPTQTRVGDLWLAGVLPISGEHAATSINESVVEWLAGGTPDADPGLPVVVASVDPEEHVLAAAVVAVQLGALGTPLHLVAGEASADELIRSVERFAARAVLLSVTMTSALVGCRAVLADLRAASVPAVVGGRAWGGDPRRALALGATAYASTALDAWRTLQDLPERPAPQPDPGARVSRRGADEVMRQRFAIAAQMSPRLLDLLVVHERQVPGWWPDLAAQLDHLVGALAASLALDDPLVLWELDEWLVALMSARGRVEVVRLVWDVLSEALAERHPEAQAALRRAGLAPEAGQ